MNKVFKAILLTTMLPLTVSANNDLTSWYLGGGLGINNYEPNCDEKTMKVCGEDSPYAWEVYTGYLFNDYFGVQLGYQDLGHTEWIDYSNKSNDVSVSGVNLGLVGFLPLANRWSASAEVGVLNYVLANNKNQGSEYYSDHGNAPYIGVGLGYNITSNLKVQAKYKRYENLNDDKWNTLAMESNYWGLELSYRFGAVDTTPINTPQSVPAVMAITDSDNDKVFDDFDQCPNTPRSHAVDVYGCTVYENTTANHNISVTFDNNSTIVNKASAAYIEQLTIYVKDHPDAKISIAGHTSSIGTANYNMALSLRRAAVVADILVNQYGVDADNISTKGYGYSQPAIQDVTIEANTANRRVNIIVTSTKKAPVLK